MKASQFTGPLARLADAYSALHSITGPNLRWDFESLEDLENRRPGYGPGFFELAHSTFIDPIQLTLIATDAEQSAAFSEIGEEGLMLLGAASLIVQRLEVPPMDLRNEVVVILSAVRLRP